MHVRRGIDPEGRHRCGVAPVAVAQVRSEPTVFAASTVEPAVPRVCARCLRPIKRGQLFRVKGPRHAFCDPPARLDVQAVAQAARQR